MWQSSLTKQIFLETHGGMKRIIFNVFQEEDKRIYEKILGVNILVCRKIQYSTDEIQKTPIKYVEKVKTLRTRIRKLQIST